MELKGGVSANLHFIESAILCQENIREYMSKYHSVDFFLLPEHHTEYKRYLSNHYNFFLGNPAPTPGIKLSPTFVESEIITVSS